MKTNPFDRATPGACAAALLAAVLALPAVSTATTAADTAADTGYTIGTRLSQAQQAALGGAREVQIGGQAYRVLPDSKPRTLGSGASAAEATSLVVNARGVVGESRNEVLVSRVPVQAVQQAVGQLGIRTVSVQYYEHIAISSLRFASFEDTAAARERLKSLLPADAGVDVPIRYSKITVR